ncbi:hypothetical protein [Sphingomonas sp. Leaf23]|uniref:hypothetical protein n=1 Tax=Sphingomonas sp. Leaf23 TaxID=1735689 RepID=UPI000A696087|nr:hypothetical protein [Sphingomonas sp. Leaf23]
MFDVGDLVVCVDAHSPAKYTPTMTPGAVAAALGYLRQGAYYRISAMPDAHLCRLEGDIWPPRDLGGYVTRRFRKIDAPDTEVSRLIRARKPVREGQPA